MTTAIAIPGNTTTTFLTHFFGGGLADHRYIVERFKALADGDIPRCTAEVAATTKKGRRKARRDTATLNEVILAIGDPSCAGRRGFTQRPDTSDARADSVGRSTRARGSTRIPVQAA